MRNRRTVMFILVFPTMFFYLFGMVGGAARRSVAALACWVSSLVFTAFGLLVGFLLPSENVMQFVGPMLAIMAMFGGIFIPLQVLPQTLQTIARFTPMFGVGQMAWAPLSGELSA